MASNDYHFVTVWHIPATPEEITEVLGDAPALARWWPSVYLTVRQVAPGDEQGLGKVVELWTKGYPALHVALAVHRQPNRTRRPGSGSRRVAISWATASGPSPRSADRMTRAGR